LAYVNIDPSWRVDHIGGEEYCIDRQVVGRLCTPSIERNDLLDATVVDGGESLAYPWRSVAQTDVSVSPAGLAEFHESSIFKRLHKYWQFTIR
jgi:hypothetical protein